MKKRIWPRWRLMLLSGLLCPPVLGAQQIARERPASPEIAPGRPAPEIDLSTLGGERVRLSALRGHPVILTFWGTWCPPCREEFPALVAAHRKYRDAGLDVLAVNQRDQEVSIQDVEVFVRQYGVEFTVALDPRGKSRRNYRLIALPTTVFVDTAGVIRHVTSGPSSLEELARGLASILPSK